MAEEQITTEQITTEQLVTQGGKLNTQKMKIQDKKEILGKKTQNKNNKTK